VVAGIGAVAIGAWRGSRVSPANGTVPQPQTALVPAGRFIAGSDAAEREAAYRLDEAGYGHSLTRENGWYDKERPRAPFDLPSFHIALMPVTNDEYARFVVATGHRVPNVTVAEWESYRLVHPFDRTRRFAWLGTQPPKGRERHPVVLVAFDDAMAYANWLSASTGLPWRLPGELEWEKAARGVDGRRFPWGDVFDPSRLNSHDQGPFDTMPVGSFPSGRGPWGLADMAGEVYEWTSTRAGEGRHMVKGGSWDDKGCGVCRAAARHSRPDGLKHIIIGFRVARDGG
jgi:formylglycine-generating enzyme required for sulfatase activity